MARDRRFLKNGMITIPSGQRIVCGRLCILPQHARNRGLAACHIKVHRPCIDGFHSPLKNPTNSERTHVLFATNENGCTRSARHCPGGHGRTLWPYRRRAAKRRGQVNRSHHRYRQPCVQSRRRRHRAAHRHHRPGDDRGHGCGRNRPPPAKAGAFVQLSAELRFRRHGPDLASIAAWHGPGIRCWYW